MANSVYRVSCYSQCGTYFMPYLKSVTLFADSHEHAIKRTSAYLKEMGRSFLRSKEHWKVLCLCSSASGSPIIDTDTSSDY